MEYSKILDRLSSIDHQVRQNPRCHMDNYADFSEIPSKHRGFLDLVYWMSREYRTIEDIPEGYRSDRLMFYSLYERPHRFEFIASSSPRYYAICEFALWRNSHAIREVPQVFMTEALVRRLTLGECRGSVLEMLKYNTEFEYLYTDELVRLTLRRSLGFLHVLDKRGILDLAPWSVIEERLENAPYECIFVVKHRRDLLRDMMKRGFWLKSMPSTSRLGPMEFQIRPETPGDVALQWSQANKVWSKFIARDNQQLFAVRMECFPDCEVIPELVATAHGRAFLQYFFHDEKVRKFFDSYQAVRGYLLEQDLAV